MSKKILVLPGDGIGPEIVAQAVRVLKLLREQAGLDVTIVEATVGGAAYDETGHPMPESTLAQARSSNAILLGAVGGPQYESLPRELRPERALLGLRSELKLFSNLRPALMYPALTEASSLKPRKRTDGWYLFWSSTGHSYAGQWSARRVQYDGL